MATGKQTSLEKASPADTIARRQHADPLPQRPILHDKLIGNLPPIIKRYAKSSDVRSMRAGGRAATIIVGLCGEAIVAVARRIPGKSGAFRLHAFAPGASVRGWRVATEADVQKTLLRWKGITAVGTFILKGEGINETKPSSDSQQTS